MRIFTTEENDDVLFKVSDFPPEYVPVFEGAYYSLVDGSYIKRFPKDTPNVSQIRTNWEAHAGDMFSQMGYFTDVLWEEALLEFIGRLDGTNISGTDLDMVVAVGMRHAPPNRRLI